MSDDELRRLERAFRATGSVDDHARWIAARLRAGRLHEPRARLAAELGHEAARLALELSGIAVADVPLEEVLGRRFLEVERETRGLALRFDLDPWAPRATPETFDGVGALRWLCRRIAGIAAERACDLPLPSRQARLAASLKAWAASPSEDHELALLADLDEAERLDRSELEALLPAGVVGLLDAAIEEERALQARVREALRQRGVGEALLVERPGLDPWAWGLDDDAEDGPCARVGAALRGTTIFGACMALRAAAELAGSEESVDGEQLLASLRALESHLPGFDARRVAAELGPYVLGDAAT